MDMQLLHIIGWMGASSIIIAFLPLFEMNKIIKSFSSKPFLFVVFLVLTSLISLFLFYLHCIESISVISINL